MGALRFDNPLRKYFQGKAFFQWFRPEFGINFLGVFNQFQDAELARVAEKNILPVYPDE